MDYPTLNRIRALFPCGWGNGENPGIEISYTSVDWIHNPMIYMIIDLLTFRVYVSTPWTRCMRGLAGCYSHPLRTTSNGFGFGGSMQQYNPLWDQWQITHLESCTLFLGILLLWKEFYSNPIVFPGISYTFQTRDIPLGGIRVVFDGTDKNVPWRAAHIYPFLMPGAQWNLAEGY